MQARRPASPRQPRLWSPERLMTPRSTAIRVAVAEVHGAGAALAARRMTRTPPKATGEALVECRKELETLHYRAAEGSDAAALTFEMLGQTLQFLVDLYACKRKYRSRIAHIVVQLMSFEGWRTSVEVADAATSTAVREIAAARREHLRPHAPGSPQVDLDEVVAGTAERGGEAVGKWRVELFQATGRLWALWFVGMLLLPLLAICGYSAVPGQPSADAAWPRRVSRWCVWLGALCAACRGRWASGSGGWPSESARAFLRRPQPRSSQRRRQRCTWHRSSGAAG